MTDLQVVVGSKDGRAAPAAPPWEQMQRLAIHSLGSPHSQRVFASGLKLFLAWCRFSDRSPLERATVQAFRAHLESRQLAASTVNVYLAAVRKLAAECATEGWLDPIHAAAIASVKGARSQGVRSGHWLSPEEASSLLSLPDVTTPKGSRDRAVLALLLGCGLRRAELCRLRLGDFERRDGRWVILDLVGKGKKFRTVPVPTWVKDSVDHWAAQAGITQGRLFRAVNKGGEVWGEGLAEDTIWAIAREYGTKCGQPALAPHHLRRTCARLCRVSGGALEQIQFLLGHASIQTTERYLGTRQELAPAVNDHLPLEIPAAGTVLATRKGPRRERGVRILAAAVPDGRLSAKRAIDDTRSLL